MSSLNDYQILQDDAGVHVASNGAVSLTCEPSGRIYKRRAIRRALSPNAEAVMWLVGELDDVKLYVQRDEHGAVHMIMTRQDLYP